MELIVTDMVPDVSQPTLLDQLKVQNYIYRKEGCLYMHNLNKLFQKKSYRAAVKSALQCRRDLRTKMK